MFSDNIKKCEKRRINKMTYFEYRVGLKLALPQPPKSLVEYKDFLYESAEKYNEVCSQRNNSKEINILEIKSNKLVILLKSSLELTTPGKAIRSFSQILLKNEKFAEEYLFGKQLFTSYDIAKDLSETQKQKNSNITAEDISDTVFLNALINYFLNKRGGNQSTTKYLQKRKCINKMKILAVESEIIKMEELDI